MDKTGLKFRKREDCWILASTDCRERVLRQSKE